MIGKITITTSNPTNIHNGLARKDNPMFSTSGLKSCAYGTTSTLYVSKNPISVNANLKKYNPYARHG
jgi:hypothetical protein